MLSYLHVKNIALIDDLEVDFDRGYNVMTGETGAGKSIIIGAMNAVLGNRMDKGFIREGADGALVELLFNGNPEGFSSLCEAFNVEGNDEGELLVSRRIAANGRSVYKVNGQTVNGKTVKEMTARLIDIHSQHEHQSLLRKENHLSLLDKYLGKGIESELAALRSLNSRRSDLRHQIGHQFEDEAARNREISFLDFEINEIESAMLQKGEDKALDKEYRLLNNVKKIQSALDKVYRMTSPSGDSSIASYTGDCLEAIEGIRDLDEGISSLYDQMMTIDSLVQDFARDLEHYTSGIEADDEKLEVVEARIDTIHQLKNKYGDTIESILDNLEKKRQVYKDMVNYEENIEKIKAELASIDHEMSEAAASLTLKRKKGAGKIAAEIESILKELNFNNCEVAFSFEEKDAPDGNGRDDVEIRISTNRNEPLKPLVQIASGGELSRVMLAIKTVFADLDDIGTLVFDEIDTGISGRTAQKVAERINDLSKRRQVLCITHLPQLAAMADDHYLIEKVEAEEKVSTSMRKLDGEACVTELARLIGGAKITENVIASAGEMKRLAGELKG